MRMSTWPLCPAHNADDIRVLPARRHEVHQHGGSGGGLEGGFNDQRVGQIPQIVRRYVAAWAARRSDLPEAMLLGTQQRSEAGIGREGRPAEPVDRTVARDQGGGLAIADQRVIFDPDGVQRRRLRRSLEKQGCSPESSMLMMFCRRPSTPGPSPASVVLLTMLPVARFPASYRMLVAAER